MSFFPTIGQVYLNTNGTYYKCIGYDEEGRAVMQSQNRWKWTFSAVGCRKYTDGTIDWAFSLNGRYEK